MNSKKKIRSSPLMKEDQGNDKQVQKKQGPENDDEVQ